MNAPAILERMTEGERGTYLRGASRARLAYLRKHGSPATSNDGERVPAAKVRASAAAWKLEHGAAYDAAADRAGLSAVRKLHRGRLELVESRPAGVDVDTLERWASEARERLEVLELVKPARAPRKTAAPAVVPAAPAVVETPAQAAPRKRTRWVTCDAHRDKWRGMPARRRAEWWLEGGPGSPCAGEHLEACKLYPGTDYFSPDICHGEHRAPWQDAAPAVVLEPVPVPVAPDVVPDSVPAPMPRMSRAALRESKRELARRLRAAGLEPRGEVWERAKRGELEGIAGLEPAGGAR